MNLQSQVLGRLMRRSTESRNHGNRERLFLEGRKEGKKENREKKRKEKRKEVGGREDIHPITAS